MQGLGAPACARFLTAWFAGKERGTFWGFWTASNNVGGFLAPLLAGTAARHYGWRYAHPCGLSTTQSSHCEVVHVTAASRNQCNKQQGTHRFSWCWYRRFLLLIMSLSMFMSAIFISTETAQPSSLGLMLQSQGYDSIVRLDMWAHLHECCMNVAGGVCMHLVWWALLWDCSSCSS